MSFIGAFNAGQQVAVRPKRERQLLKILSDRASASSVPGSKRIPHQFRGGRTRVKHHER